MAAAAPSAAPSVPEWESALERGTVGFEDVCVAVHGISTKNPNEEFRTAAREYFPQLMRVFQETNGDLVEAYYCSDVVAGCGLTRKTGAKGERADYRLHTVSGLATATTAPIAALITQVERMCIDANELASEAERATQTRRIFSVATYLLGLLNDASVPGKLGVDDVRAELRIRRDELAQIGRDHAALAQRDAQITYFNGMLIGLAVAVAAATGVALALVASDAAARTRDNVVGVLAAGAAGAFVSVLTRMSGGRLRLDFRTGRAYLRLLGVFRPVIGALMALALYFLIVGKLLSVFAVPAESALQFYFFCGIAFLAGFSERWAQDMLAIPERAARRPTGDSDGAAERGSMLEPTPASADDPAPPPPPLPPTTAEAGQDGPSPKPAGEQPGRDRPAKKDGDAGDG